MNNIIEKWFPADHNITRTNAEGKEVSTFLADKSLDGFLYSYYLEKSIGIDGKTIVKKKSLPRQTEIAEKVNLKYGTFRDHLRKLLESPYMEEITLNNEKCYYLPIVEKFTFRIPLKTLEAINKGLKDEVIKVYIYLGSQPIGYKFTLQELGAHTGVGNTKGNSKPYDSLWYRLYFLQKLGLLNLSQHWDSKGRPYMQIDNISTDLDHPIRGFEDREWTRQDGAKSMLEIKEDIEGNYR